MFLCNEENDSNILHTSQISVHLPHFTADLLQFSRNSFSETVLCPEGENLDMKGPSSMWQWFITSGTTEWADCYWQITFYLVVHPNNVSNKARLVCFFFFFVSITLSFRPYEIDMYPPSLVLTFCFLSSTKTWHFIISVLVSKLPFLTNQSLTIKISRAGQVQFHSAGTLTSRHHQQ